MSFAESDSWIAFQTVTFALAAIWSAVLAVWSRGRKASSFASSGEAHLVHIVMNGTMAVMPFTMGDQTGRSVIVLALAFTALFVTARMMMVSRTLVAWERRQVITGSTYHLLALVIMIVSTLTMHSSEEMSHAGHMAMSDGADLGWLRSILILVFLVDGLATLALTFFAPATLFRMSGTVIHSAADIRDLRLAAPPHVVMDLGMALMLAA